MIRLAPSMMCADFLNLGVELDRFTAAGIDWLHMDVMDGHYVPNLTLGIDYCKAVAARCAIPHDVHLMVEQPDRYLEIFAGLPGARITFHPETTRHPVATIQRIRALGASPGIAIDPGFTAEAFTQLYPLVDQVCVMTVNPGYAGQKLIHHAMDTLRGVRAILDQVNPQCDLEVDGNVSWENIPKMVAAGANVLVCGTSSIFDKSLKREEGIAKVKGLIGR